MWNILRRFDNIYFHSYSNSIYLNMIENGESLNTETPQYVLNKSEYNM